MDSRGKSLNQSKKVLPKDRDLKWQVKLLMLCSSSLSMIFKLFGGNFRELWLQHNSSSWGEGQAAFLLEVWWCGMAEAAAAGVPISSQENLGAGCHTCAGWHGPAPACSHQHFHPNCQGSLGLFERGCVTGPLQHLWPASTDAKSSSGPHSPLLTHKRPPNWTENKPDFETRTAWPLGPACLNLLEADTACLS